MRAWTASRRAGAWSKTCKRKGLLDRVVNYTPRRRHLRPLQDDHRARASTQWFARMKPLAEPAIVVVERGEIEIIPENWRAVYFEWLRNIRDWCISRQLWWATASPRGTAATAPGSLSRANRRQSAPSVARPRSSKFRRARHLVQLRAVAVLHAGLAGPD